MLDRVVLECTVCLEVGMQAFGCILYVGDDGKFQWRTIVTGEKSTCTMYYCTHFNTVIEGL